MFPALISRVRTRSRTGVPALGGTGGRLVRSPLRPGHTGMSGEEHHPENSEYQGQGAGRVLRRMKEEQGTEGGADPGQGPDVSGKQGEQGSLKFRLRDVSQSGRSAR